MSLTIFGELAIKQLEVHGAKIERRGISSYKGRPNGADTYRMRTFPKSEQKDLLQNLCTFEANKPIKNKLLIESVDGFLVAVVTDAGSIYIFGDKDLFNKYFSTTQN